MTDITYYTCIISTILMLILVLVNIATIFGFDASLAMIINQIAALGLTLAVGIGVAEETSRF